MANQRRNQGNQRQGQGVQQAIRQLGEGGISKQEIKQIQKDTGVSVQRIVQQLDRVNQNLREAEKPRIALNSGAANMLIRQATRAPTFNQPSFGSGSVGRALTKAIGTPGYTAPRNPQSGGPYGGSRAAVPGTGLIPAGMQIRGGGNLGVKGFGQQYTAPNSANSIYNLKPSSVNLEGADPIKLDAGTEEFLNSLKPGNDSGSNINTTTSDQDYLDLLNSLSDLFTQQMQGMFDPLQEAIGSLANQQQMDDQALMRFYGAGQNYNTAGIRAAMRDRKPRKDYLRSNMSIGSTGGAGLTNALSGLSGALGTLGGLTV
jgi:hypothetical protein